MSKYYDEITKEIRQEIKEELNILLDPLRDLTFIQRGKTELIQKYLKNQQRSLEDTLSLLDTYTQMQNFEVADYYCDIAKDILTKTNDLLNNPEFCYETSIISALSWEDALAQENQSKSVIRDVSEIREIDAAFIKANIEYSVDKENTQKEIGNLIKLSNDMQPQKISECRENIVNAMSPEIRKASDDIKDIFSDDLKEEISALKQTINELNKQISVQNEIIYNLEKNYISKSTNTLSTALDKASGSLQKTKDSIVRTGKESCYSVYSVLKDAYSEANKTFSTARSICAQTFEKATKTYSMTMETLTLGAYSQVMSKLSSQKEEYIQKNPDKAKLLNFLHKPDADYYKNISKETWNGKSPIQTLIDNGHDIYKNLNQMGRQCVDLAKDKINSAISSTKNTYTSTIHFLKNNISNACNMLKANTYGSAAKIVELYGKCSEEVKKECVEESKEIKSKIQSLQNKQADIQKQIEDLNASRKVITPSEQLQKKLDVLDKFGDLDLKEIKLLKKSVEKELKDIDKLQLQEDKKVDKEISKLNRSSNLISSAIKANMERFTIVTDKLVDIHLHVDKVKETEKDLTAKAIATARDEAEVDLELD